MRVTARSSILALSIAGTTVLAGCEGDTIRATYGRLEMKCCSDITTESQRVSDRVDFGQVQVGIVSSRELLVKNVGEAVLTISKIEADDQFSTGNWEFKISDSTFQLTPNETKLVTITFQPFADMTEPALSAVKVHSDAKDNDGNAIGPTTLTLTGQGIRSGLQVENPIDFGRVLIGSSRILSVEVKNNLTVPVIVTTPLGSDGKPAIVNQGGQGRFEIISPVGVSGSLVPDNGMLAPGTSIQVELKYTPDQGQEGREERAKWTLSNCSNPLCDLDITLLGTGTNTAIECTPPTIDFGDVNPNNVVTKTTSCRNSATESVTVTNVGLAPGAAREYTVDPFLGGPTLTPGQTFDVTVRFSPTLATVGQTPAGFVVIEGRNPAANRDLTATRVSLSGRAGGPDIAVSPLTVDFGQIAIGTAGKKRVLIENTGYSPLMITEIIGDTAMTGAFSVDKNMLGINMGDAEVLEISFAPTSEGLLESEVSIINDDADESDVRVVIRGTGVALPPCMYTMQPTSINFGIVQSGRATTQGFRITNTGTDRCLINDIEIAVGSDPVFGLLNGVETGIFLEPGDTKSVVLTYNPDNQGVDMGELTFYISDPTNPNITIPLHGTGSDSALLISPNEVDFGVIGVDCSTRDRVITVFNTGGNNITVTRIERPTGVSSEFEVDNLPNGIPSPPAGGAVIVPGQSIDFVVRYHANDIGVDVGFIHLFTMGQTDPYVIPVYGEGSTDPTNEDRYTQLETPEVDILFVIDNSCSMSEEQTSLIGNFRSFIQFADSQALDYHLAVVTTDVDDVTTFGSCPNPLVAQRPNGVGQGACGYFADGDFQNAQRDPDWRIVTPDEQPSAEAAFAAIANQDISGSGFEQPLQAAFQALSPPLLNGWNDGFIRQSAYLALIMVTDELDQSPQTVDFYTNFLLAIKGFRNTQLFSASAITGDSPGGCSSANGTADDGARLLEVVRRTGGVFESICTADWAQALQNLGLSVFGYKSRFFLSNQPVGGTVVVTVDGMVVDATAPSGQVRWSYDVPTNSVNFAPLAIPEPGSEIVITYTAECL